MLPGDLSLFWSFIKRDWTFVALVISLFGLSLGGWMNIGNPFILMLGLILFSAWDAICYEVVGRSDNREHMIRYRIGQTSVQILIITLLGLLSDWNAWVVLGFFYLWWMGVCDVIFYILIGRLRDMLRYGDMFWLWWTPLGMMNRWTGKETSGISVFHIAVYAVVLWFIIWLFYPSISYWRLVDFASYFNDTNLAYGHNLRHKYINGGWFGDISHLLN